MSEPAPGQRIGEYVLEVPLGSGGFSTVWQARHHAFPDRRVAAKMMLDPRRAELLRGEADCLRALDHTGIARAIGVDVTHDPPYLLVELHPGRNLRQLLDQTPLSPERAGKIFRQLTEALAHAHERGVAHGDLKPENVLIDHTDTVKLTDFGLGHQVSSEASLLLSGGFNSLDSSPTLAGTLPYMSPEQREGKAPDPTSDVFSLGIMLYEMVKRRRPQPGDDPREDLHNAPAWLGVWEKCFTRRDRRYRDAGEVLKALERWDAPEVRVRVRSDEHVAPRAQSDRSAQSKATESKAPEAKAPESKSSELKTPESDRQRLVIKPGQVGPRPLRAGLGLGEIERIVAQECDLRLEQLRTPPGSERAGSGAWARFEERILGWEDDVRKGRSMVWFVAHEFLREDLGYLAERYGVSRREVEAGVLAVRRRRIPQAPWRRVVGRLAALPSGVAEEAKSASRPGFASQVGAMSAYTSAAVLIVPALVAIASGQFWLGAALLAAVASLATGGAVLMVGEQSKREAWIESHLDALPGEDRREKLARLAIQPQLRGLARTANRLLEREPIEVKVRPRTASSAEPRLSRGEPAIELPSDAPRRREEPLPSVEPGPAAEPTPGTSEALIAERAARAREGERRAQAEAPASGATRATVEAPPPEAEPAQAEESEASADALIAARAALARSREALAAAELDPEAPAGVEALEAQPEPTREPRVPLAPPAPQPRGDDAPERKGLDELLRERAQRARAEERAGEGEQTSGEEQAEPLRQAEAE